MTPEAPTIIQQPAPVTTETAAKDIAEEQRKNRAAAAKAMGRSKTMLTASDINAVTGEQVGSSLLGG